MSDLTDQLNVRIKDEKEYMENEVTKGHDRMAALEEMIRQEREDRVASLE